MFKKILPHICIVLGGMFVVFSIINYFNAGMNFINNDISLVLLLLLAVFSMIQGGCYIADSRSGKIR